MQKCKAACAPPSGSGARLHFWGEKEESDGDTLAFLVPSVVSARPYAVCAQGLLGRCRSGAAGDRASLLLLCLLVPASTIAGPWPAARRGRHVCVHTHIHHFIMRINILDNDPQICKIQNQQRNTNLCSFFIFIKAEKYSHTFYKDF